MPNHRKNETANPRLAAQLARDVDADRSPGVPPGPKQSRRRAPISSRFSAPVAETSTGRDARTTNESPEETMLSRNREALLRQLEKDYLLKLQDWNRE